MAYSNSPLPHQEVCIYRGLSSGDKTMCRIIGEQAMNFISDSLLLRHACGRRKPRIRVKKGAAQPSGIQAVLITYPSRIKVSTTAFEAVGRGAVPRRGANNLLPQVISRVLPPLAAWKDKLTARKDGHLWKRTQCWQRGRFAKPLGRSNATSEVGTHRFRHAQLSYVVGIKVYR